MIKHSLLALFLSLPAFSQDKVYESEGTKFKVETVLKRKDVIWGFDFLPDGRILVTERGGALVRFDPKTKEAKAISGAPKVFSEGQGGLLDVRVRGPWVYYSYSEPVGEDKATTALARAKLEGDALAEQKKLFTGWEPNDNEIHFGSRIEFDGKGHVFFTMGDRDERKNAQSLGHHQGKVLRLKEDGSVPSDNPFVSRKGAKAEVWSYGHRNPQGLALDPSTGELWETEMGPRGGDELNRVEPGSNYGWPVVTYGREYYGPKIGEGEKKAGITDPVAHWVPSISPSGAGFYSGDAFPKWKGDLFFGNLSGMHLRRIVLKDGKAVKQEKLLDDLGWRVRCVRQGPDGYLYLSTDGGELARLMPVT